MSQFVERIIFTRLETQIDAMIAEPRLYERLWRREIGAEMRDSRFLSRYVFADLSRVGRLVRGVRAYPPLAGLLADYATGAASYETVRRKFILKFPRIGAKLAVRYLTHRN